MLFIWLKPNCIYYYFLILSIGKRNGKNERRDEVLRRKYACANLVKKIFSQVKHRKNKEENETEIIIFIIFNKSSNIYLRSSTELYI